MTPTIVLLLAAVAASDVAATPQPSALPAEARKLRALARSDLSQDFLKAAEDAPPYTARTVYRRGKAREWLDTTAFARLTAAGRAGWTSMTIDEDTYQGLFCGSPLAYLLVADRRGLGVGLSCMPDLNKPGGVANRRPLPMQTRWATRVAQF